ncbi:MAG: hypothetical protein FJ317_04775, partial [SAR202 cluster bacterium]|nr:hypothetical protein [SAR202 cluster bacterium]
TPESLGSPWSAAISSFVAFGIGAIVPIIPFIFQGSSRVLAGISGAASGFALLLVGGALAYFSGRNVPLGAVRMFLIGAVAAGITYGAGSLIGTVIN